MSFDLELALILASFVTGLIWLTDQIWWRKQRNAQNLQRGEQAHEPWYVEYSRAFFPVLLIVLLLRSFVAEPFRIPSGSMMPNLLVGDFILVDKFAYGLRLPLIHAQLLPVGNPRRGNVVVFHYPEKGALVFCGKNPVCFMEGGLQQVRGSVGEDYIKRLIGLPGDKICYQDNHLSIDGKKVKKVYVGIYKGEGPNHFMAGTQKWMEYLPRRNGTIIKHLILIIPGNPAPSGCVTVPSGHYFMMGDNRDYSFDSRYWGVVPRRDLVGKAFLVWFNWDFRDNHIDWYRIGTWIK